MNNEKETVTFTIEVNRRIKEEYVKGLRNLSNAAPHLSRQPVEALINKGLHYRQNWLRTMTAHREYQKQLRARNEAPEEIRQGKGLVWWTRNGKPSL
jgi:hypothetical protein